MSFVPAKCPSCGGKIQLDDQHETGFCAYCGSKVAVKEALSKMAFLGSASADVVAAIEKQLHNAETFRKLGDSEKETEVLKQITRDYPEDYHAWLNLAMEYIDEYGEGDGLVNYFDECYLPTTDDCISDYFRLLDDENIKYALILAPEDETMEMKRKLRELAKPLLTYLEAEKQALIKSHEYFQESIKVRDRAVKALKNAVREPKRHFLFRKKGPNTYELWNNCLDNELERSAINRKIYHSYWIYPAGRQYPEWQNNGSYGEFYKMYLRDCNSSYCSIDVGIKRNEKNLMAVLNMVKEYSE